MLQKKKSAKKKKKKNSAFGSGGEKVENIDVSDVLGKIDSAVAEAVLSTQTQKTFERSGCCGCCHD